MSILGSVRMSGYMTPFRQKVSSINERIVASQALPFEGLVKVVNGSIDYFMHGAQVVDLITDESSVINWMLLCLTFALSFQSGE